MKNYQDEVTGQIYTFEDDYDPFLSDNRNIPKTLTKNIKTKLTETSVWYGGGWIERADVPIDYIEPVSNVPSYNPAWIVHLRPYSAIISDKQPQLNFTLEFFHKSFFTQFHIIDSSN